MQTRINKYKKLEIKISFKNLEFYLILKHFNQLYVIQRCCKDTALLNSCPTAVWLPA